MKLHNEFSTEMMRFNDDFIINHRYFLRAIQNWHKWSYRMHFNSHLPTDIWSFIFDMQLSPGRTFQRFDMLWLMQFLLYYRYIVFRYSLGMKTVTIRCALNWYLYLDKTKLIPTKRQHFMQMKFIQNHKLQTQMQVPH